MYLNITLNLRANFDVNEAEKRLIDQSKKGRISHLDFISMRNEQVSLHISEDQRLPAVCAVLYFLGMKRMGMITKFFLLSSNEKLVNI